jgi:hypothetical protein
LQVRVTVPVGHVPALSAWHVPPSAVAQHSCEDVVHVLDPQGMEPGSLGAPPSGIVAPAEPLLLPVPPSPPLLPVPPSPLPPLDEPPLLLVTPLLAPPPSSPELPLDDPLVPLLAPPPLLDPKPLLLPCPPPSFPEPLVLLPLQCASTTGAAASARTQKAIVV